MIHSNARTHYIYILGPPISSKDESSGFSDEVDPSDAVLAVGMMSLHTGGQFINTRWSAANRSSYLCR